MYFVLYWSLISRKPDCKRGHLRLMCNILSRINCQFYPFPLSKFSDENLKLPWQICACFKSLWFLQTNKYLIYVKLKVFHFYVLFWLHPMILVMRAYVEKFSFVRGAFQETLSIFSVAPIFFLGSWSNKHKKNHYIGKL